METKAWWKSKTIIGAIAMGLSLLTRTLGLDLGDEQLTETANAIVELVGFVLVIVGRWKADKPLSTTGG